METTIIENLIPKSYQDEIKHELLESGFFPWFWNPSTVDSTKQYESKLDLGDLEDARDDIQMYHLFVNNTTGIKPSPYFSLVKPILFFLEQKTGITVKEIHRIKANLTFSTNGNEGGVHIPHTDQSYPGCVSLVYYVNNSDGDTITYDQYFNNQKQQNFSIEKTSTPFQGNAILLDSDRFHSSSLPVNTDTRCVINFIFKI